MALWIIDGVLGAGKTYYAVYWLATKWCVQLKTNNRYVIDPDKKVKIITNIDCLSLPHESFQKLVDEAGGLSSFFTVDYQRELTGDYNVIYILDEAQQWFRNRYAKLTNDNLFYFEYSRHLGHDVFLITQDERNLVPSIVRLAESIKTAQPRTLNIANELTYKAHTAEGVELGIERVFFSKKIAALYKSMDRKEAVKIKNPLARKFFAALVIACLLVFSSGYMLYKRWTSKPEHPPNAQALKSKPVVSSAPVVQSKSGPTVFTGSIAGEYQAEWYMYRLDFCSFGSGVLFRFGISWMPEDRFPYFVVQKEKEYYAMIPARLLPSLDDGSRAYPVDFSPDDLLKAQKKASYAKRAALKPVSNSGRIKL